MKRSLPIAFLTAAIACGSTARADQAPYNDPRDQTRFSLSLDWWPSADANVAAFDAEAQVIAARHFAVDLQVPWAAGTLQDDPHGIGGPGNILVSLYGIGNIRPYGELWGGGTVIVPTMYQSSDTVTGISQNALLTYAAMSRDGLDPERFFPGVAGADIFLGWGIRFARYFHYRGEFRMVMAGSAAIQSTAFLFNIQEIHELEGRFPFGLVLGLRFQFMIPAFLLLTALQSAAGTYQPLAAASMGIGPYIGYEPEGRGFFARLGMQVGMPPLNSPFSQSTAVFASATFGYRL